MAVSHKIGNSIATPHKQAALVGGLAGLLVGTSAAIAQKYRRQAVILDMTCGTGIVKDGSEGSPLILAKVIYPQIEIQRPISLRCVDRNEKYLSVLRGVLAERYPQVPTRYFTDQRAALADLPPDIMGVAYFDPTRYNDLDVNLLREMGQRFPLLDILLTRECLAMRRMLAAEHTRGNTLTIKDYIEATGKRCLYWAQYAKHSWWAFAFADNWQGRKKEQLCWHDANGRPAGRLVPIDSERGTRMFARWMGDRGWHQPRLID